jgi:CBS domain-containing protein
MSKPLITADVDTLAHEAINLMVKKDIGALVVTGKGKPVGIITERDVLTKCCPDASCDGIKIGQIMSKPLITVDADTPIGLAVESMIDKRIRRLLVTEGSEVVGIVTQKDLMRGTTEAFRAMHSAFSLPSETYSLTDRKASASKM